MMVSHSLANASGWNGDPRILNAELSLPVTSGLVQTEAAEALKQLGTEAKEALPVLKEVVARVSDADDRTGRSSPLQATLKSAISRIEGK